MKDSSSFNKAKKRLDQLKGFYTHLTAYCIVNCVLLIVYFYSKESLFQGTSNDEFVLWVDWNVILTPLIWGAFLVAHAACVFKWSFPFLKRWEERQIKKFMEKENQGI
jgi:ABC-type phosphate transport system permease subunit